MTKDDSSTSSKKSGLFARLLGREGQTETPVEAKPAKRLWFARLRGGLARTSDSLGQAIAGIFTTGGKIDPGGLADLEDILIQADLGPETAARMLERIGKSRYEGELGPDQIKEILAHEVERTLAAVALPLAIDATQHPFVILVVGVNGAGKTTTIGKLAAKFRADGRSVVLVAGDTFRAAAIQQLQLWGKRSGAEVVAREQGSDPAALAFDALREAADKASDVLIMDTAGRLQNRTELMAELQKIVRVLRKVDAAAPHAVLLVLDATVGQNALSQVEVFRKVAGVTGLVMTKLDGTARGGILVALAERFKLPVHFIGIGESVDDLEPFEARDFARAIAGLEQ
jgi:fused signal recognition particle receptor